MGKHIRERHKQIIYLFIEAVEKIGCLVDKGNNQEAMFVLSECQDVAMALGNNIEKIYGTETCTVKELERYCESLYRVYIALEEQRDFGYEMDNLKNNVKRMKDTYDFELNKQLEVVFLPYKVAMWDSMASIYAAMKNDSRIRVVVIPIPYYEVKEDGSYGEFHYEANLFPANVTITKYDEYDFEGINPDIIFIHNPYDDYNRVTRVVDFFFSRNIRKYTSRLVYIPYFITGGYMAEGFNYMPSYMNMDYIITQSEEMKKFYDPQFHKKLIPLGSPKADSILEDVDMETVPTSWKNKIKGKKVFLYNTSISALLQNNEGFLEKIRYVIKCFEDKENVVLLWRPHPLLLTTIKAMRPDYEDEYIKIVDQFKSMENAIYDENSDVSMAVKISDAYVGESTSSMVCLFGILGKPIFLTNPNIRVDSLYIEKNKYAYDCVEVDGGRWILSGMGNDLYYMSQDGMLKQYPIPNEWVDGVRLYNKIILCEDKLVLVPYTAHEIAIFDLKTETFEKVEYPDYQNVKLVNGVYKNDIVWMLPAIGNYILKLDVKTKEVTCKSRILSKLKVTSEDKARFFNSVILVEDSIFAASAQNNQVLVIDTNTERFEICKVGDTGDSYWSMEYDGENFWLAANEKCFITKWNYKTKECHKYSGFPRGYCGNDNCFIQLVYAEGYIYAFPKCSNAILKIDVTTGDMKILNIELPYKEGDRKSTFYNWPSNYYFARKISQDKVAVMTAYDHSLLCLNITSGDYEIYKIPMKVSEEEFYKRFRRESANIPLACKETRSATLPQFIEVASKEFLLQEEEIRLYAEVINNMDGTCGEKIKDFFLKELEIQ